MTRIEARTLLMQMLFSMDIQKDFSPKAKTAFLTGKNLGNQKKYINEMFDIITQNMTNIDNVYSSQDTKWKINRLAPVNLTIFRIAIAEILYKDDIPVSVSINEAVKLAKIYSDDESARFINGVLANLANL